MFTSCDKAKGRTALSEVEEYLKPYAASDASFAGKAQMAQLDSSQDRLTKMVANDVEFDVLMMSGISPSGHGTRRSDHRSREWDESQEVPLCYRPEEERVLGGVPRSIGPGEDTTDVAIRCDRVVAPPPRGELTVGSGQERRPKTG